ncbi:hypothetical protein BABINDRAFT_167798 [Babjeviella inositovora NRRL Y-12698]|uniref:N-acetyltransferase domain-containing protein n=1 Tax=Babjeviella inositovora NRRL Y-12698 TaxID=984486 RepID=A0A1E3QNR2_9ASCO|nr:uncharacterized protein BABINDRAFT_167798 [Babjeviella inositovora NRRL Y-12698]ODQ79278.1 hypothetical protein BABINDRAFT_167798 [Babjeviella inositovora NRRL Y-12698]
MTFEITHPTLLLIPYAVLVEHTGSPVTPQLLQIINKGYDKPRYNYGIILTARVKNGLVPDLQLKPGSFLSLLVSPDVGARAALQQSTGKADVGSWDVPGKFTCSDIQTRVVQADDWPKLALALPNVVGTIGLKPYSDHAMEITALTAFQGAVGKMLLLHAETIVKDKELVEQLAVQTGVSQFVTTVIADHDLVAYYAKFGYMVDRQAVISQSDVETNSTSLEDGVCATADFTLVYMHKDI